MKRALPTKEDLSGKRFGNLTVIKRSEKRGKRGQRSVPLWECLCDCGETTYKATDTLTGKGRNMCNACAKRYAAEKMLEGAGFIDGTQITRISNIKTESSSGSGRRGVYFDRATGKWRARLRFRGKLMDFGSYFKLEDAIEARKKAEEVYFGEFLEKIDKGDQQ